MVPNSGAENGPEFGTEMRERSPGSPSPRVRYNQLHELLGRPPHPFALACQPRSTNWRGPRSGNGFSGLPVASKIRRQSMLARAGPRSYADCAAAGVSGSTLLHLRHCCWRVRAHCLTVAVLLLARPDPLSCRWTAAGASGSALLLLLCCFFFFCWSFVLHNFSSFC